MGIVLVGAPIDRAEALPYVIWPPRGRHALKGQSNGDQGLAPGWTEPCISVVKVLIFAEILKIYLYKIAENLTFLPSFAENLIIQTLINAQILTIMAHKQRPRNREAFIS